MSKGHTAGMTNMSVTDCCEHLADVHEKLVKNTVVRVTRFI